MRNFVTVQMSGCGSFAGYKLKGRPWEGHE